MNWELTKRDVALRYVGRWIFVGPLITLTMMGVIAITRFSAGPGAERTPFDVPLVLFTLWFPAAVYTWVTASERRCSRFDMELPIASRELWMAHSVALFLAGLLVLAGTAAMLLFISWSGSVWAGLFPQVFEARDLRLAEPIVVVLLLSVALAQSVSPSLERIPGGRRTVLSIIAAIVVGYFVCLALAATPLAVGLVPVALALWLLHRTRGRLPGTVVVAPIEPGWFSRGTRARSDRAAARGADALSTAMSSQMTAEEWGRAVPARRRAGRIWVRAITAFRATTKMPVAPIVGLPFLIAAGYTMAGAFGSVIRGDDSIRFSMLFIISYMLLSFSGLPPRRLHMVDAFPIARRFVFATMFLPLVVTMGLGYAAGRIVADRGESASELLCLCERDGHYYLTAPLRLGAIAMDGSPPDAVAPWGESHEVWSTPIWTGGTPVVHSRYSTPPGSSTEFVAWQISRAVEDVYGETISIEEITQNYLTLDEAGRVVPIGGSLTLGADHPEWSIGPYGPVFPVMALLVCGPWFTAMWFYLRTLRPGYTERRKRGAFWLGMIVLMALHVSQFAALFGNLLDHWVLSGTSMIAIRELTQRLPGGAPTVWLLCGVVFYGFYRAAESRFQRVESLPGDDMRIALIERPIGAAVQDGAYAR